MCSCIHISPMVQQEPCQPQEVVLAHTIPVHQHQWSLTDLKAYVYRKYIRRTALYSSVVYAYIVSLIRVSAVIQQHLGNIISSVDGCKQQSRRPFLRTI